MCAPTLSDVTRSIAILEHWKDNWLEGKWLGCSVDRWLENKTWEDVLAWVDENESHYNSDCGFFIRLLPRHRSGQVRPRGGQLSRHRAPTSTRRCTRTRRLDGRNAASDRARRVYAEGQWYEFDQANVREDTSHSFYQGSKPLHPFDGETIPIDPEQGQEAGQVQLGEVAALRGGRPRQHPVGSPGRWPARIAAGGPNAAPHQDNDPLFVTS